MGVQIPLLSQGTRVRVQRAAWPLEPGVEGREGSVSDASEYRPQRLGVTLDGEPAARYFRPEELVMIETPALPADTVAAKRRRALP